MSASLWLAASNSCLHKWPGISGQWESHTGDLFGWDWCWKLHQIQVSVENSVCHLCLVFTNYIWMRGTTPRPHYAVVSQFLSICILMCTCAWITFSAAWMWIARGWQAGLPPAQGSTALGTSWVQNLHPAAWSWYHCHPNNNTDTPEQPASCWETGTVDTVDTHDWWRPTMMHSDSGYWFHLTNLVSQKALCLAAVIPQCLQRECLGHDCVKGKP